MKAFIFDLDGTLLDTLEDISQACNTALAAHGHPTHPLVAYRQMVGHGFVRLMRTALPPKTLEEMPPKALETLVDEARAWYGGHMRERTQPYTGIQQALEELAGRKLPLAVLSNKPDDLTQVLISHYFPRIPFALVRGGRPDTPLKPDPAAPRAMLAQLGLEPGHCFYVGDSDVDMLTAHNTGMTPVGVAWGFRGPEEVRAAGALHVIDTPAQLPDLI